MGTSLPVTGAVLVGGRSVRMGIDKAALVVEGRTLLERQLDRLRSAGANQLLVADRAGREIKPTLLSSDVVRVHDRWDDVGPMAGLDAALRGARHARVLVVAVDLPALEVDLLRGLLAGVAPGRGRVPWTSRGAEPLCAVYPRGPATAAIQRFAAVGQWSLQELVREGIGAGWWSVGSFHLVGRNNSPTGTTRGIGSRAP